MDNKLNYSRILILGSPGAGKTTFSKNLSKVLNLPVYHLDDFYWLKSWKRIDHDQWKTIIHNLCSNKKWIIDGNHFKTIDWRLPYTELVILLDYSITVCFWSFIVRSIKRYFKIDTNTLPENIKQDLNRKTKFTIQWHILWLIISYKYKTRPKLMNLISKHSIDVLILPSRNKSKAFLEQLYYK